MGRESESFDLTDYRCGYAHCRGHRLVDHAVPPSRHDPLRPVDIAILHTLHAIRMEIHAMSKDITELQAADADEAAALTTLAATQAQLITDVLDALASGDGAAIEAVTANMEARRDELNTLVTNAQAADPGAPVPPVA